MVTGGSINYTVKELLAEIRESMVAIRLQLEQHDKRIGILEEKQEEGKILRDKYIPMIDNLVLNLDIEKQLKKALDEHQTKKFTTREKIIIIVVAVIQVTISALALGIQPPVS